MNLAVAVVGSFLIGSIPFGLLVGKVVFGQDIRQTGSGNIGAANAMRSFGKIGGAAVLLLDALKGFVPTIWGLGAGHFADARVFGAFGFAALIGLAALLGHCYSPWLRWRGGKGVATHLGVSFALAWPAGLIFIGAWLASALPTGYSSVGSLTAAVATIVSLWFFTGPAGAIYGLLATLLIFWRHRANLARLRAGTENRVFGST